MRNVWYMLSMRNNMIHYVQLIDAYAPCVVSSRAWNNEANMGAYCGPNANMFERKVLSISDEAFLLVVLINYAARWQSEYANDIKKVRDKLELYAHLHKANTPNVICRSQLGRWQLTTSVACRYVHVAFDCYV